MPKISQKHYRRAKKNRDSFFQNLEALVQTHINIEEPNQASLTDDSSSVSCSGDINHSSVPLHNVSPCSSFHDSDVEIPEVSSEILNINETCSAFLEVCKSPHMDPHMNLCSSLASWAVRNQITHTAVSDLLSVLKPFHNDLPVDARTLLKTPRTIKTKVVEPGFYYHFGLDECIENLLLQYHDVNSLNCVEVYINIDGLPLFKSSQHQAYPILCRLIQNREKVEMVGIYCGVEKPKNVNLFLEDFVADSNRCITNGINFMGNYFTFIIKGLICDVPAKCYVTQTKGHSGYFSCSKCNTEGSFINGKMCFPDLNFAVRTDADFRQKVNPEHHVGISILETLKNFDLIKNVALDPMHLLYLGVVKKLIVNLWCNGKPPLKLPYSQIQIISEKLVRLRKCFTCEFNRKPRSLLESGRWKATEFRQFLLYSGPVVLKNILSKDKYLNFISLHVAATILSSPKLSDDYREYAKDLLVYFVKTFVTLYGKENVSHNVHNLLHLSEDTEYFGVLEQFSAFSFENYMQDILKFIRKNNSPLQQIVLRKSEIDRIIKASPIVKESYPQLKHEHFAGLTMHLIGQQYECLQFKHFSLKIYAPDNCCSLKNGNIIIVKKFLKADDGDIFLIGSKFDKLENFYVKPCLSSTMFSYLVNKQDLSAEQVWHIDEIDFKCVNMYFDENKCVVMPLSHLSQ